MGDLSTKGFMEGDIAHLRKKKDMHKEDIARGLSEAEIEAKDKHRNRPKKKESEGKTMSKYIERYPAAATAIKNYGSLHLQNAGDECLMWLGEVGFQGRHPTAYDKHGARFQLPGIFAYQTEGRFPTRDESAFRICETQGCCKFSHYTIVPRKRHGNLASRKRRMKKVFEELNLTPHIQHWVGLHRGELTPNSAVKLKIN